MIPPVTHEANTAGRISRFQRSHRETPRFSDASRRSAGIAEAPAMTLNRMYHCAPSAIRKMPPMSRLTPVAMSSSVKNGNRKLAGKLASTCTTGCANRVTLGFIPIHTPIGTQISVATSTRTTTRANVTRPSRIAVPNSASPTDPWM